MADRGRPRQRPTLTLTWSGERAGRTFTVTRRTGTHSGGPKSLRPLRTFTPPRWARYPDMAPMDGRHAGPPRDTWADDED